MIVDQAADGTNQGGANAGSGNTTVNGNRSGNKGVTTGNWTISKAGGVQANTANTGNQSDGVAGITTGDATAVGNSSDTGITQVADAHAGGRLGGIAIIRQSVDVTNDGDARPTLATTPPPGTHPTTKQRPSRKAKATVH